MVRPGTLLGYESDEDEIIHASNNIEEFLSKHFSNAVPLGISSLPETDFTALAEQKKNSLAVGGFFGRSAVYSLFKKSFLTGAVQYHKMPVLVAHK